MSSDRPRLVLELTDPLLISAILAAVVFTSFLSGIFGMAGGLVLMGALLMMLDVPTAMILHGVAQTAANGWRAALWLQHVQWMVIVRYMAGAAIAVALFSMLLIEPDKATVYIGMGLMPILGAAVPKRWAPSVLKPTGAPLCGFLVNACQLLAGVAGPILDMFFVRSGLDRKQIVATKAATQTLSHTVKILYFGLILDLAGKTDTETPLWLYAIAIGAAIVGTTLARGVLDRMKDATFMNWSQRIILAIAAIYLVMGIRALWLGQ